MSGLSDANRGLVLRLMGPEGEDLGVVDAGAALDRAKELDLDLVLIDEATIRPTYRILDYGKWKFELHRRGDDQHRG